MPVLTVSASDQFADVLGTARGSGLPPAPTRVGDWGRYEPQSAAARRFVEQCRELAADCDLDHWYRFQPHWSLCDGIGAIGLVEGLVRQACRRFSTDHDHDHDTRSPLSTAFDGGPSPAAADALVRSDRCLEEHNALWEERGAMQRAARFTPAQSAVESLAEHAITAALEERDPTPATRAEWHRRERALKRRQARQSR